MEFGTKIKLKKEWVINDYLTAEKGEIFNVVFCTVKYGMELRIHGVGDLIKFWYDYQNKDERINEYFEILENGTAPTRFT